MAKNYLDAISMRQIQLKGVINYARDSEREEGTGREEVQQIRKLLSI